MDCTWETIGLQIQLTKSLPSLKDDLLSRGTERDCNTNHISSIWSMDIGGEKEKLVESKSDVTLVDFFSANTAQRINHELDFEQTKKDYISWWYDNLKKNEI